MLDLDFFLCVYFVFVLFRVSLGHWRC